MTATLVRAAFVAGYAPAGVAWTPDAVRRCRAVELAELDAGTAKKAGATAALLAAVHRQRKRTHQTAAVALAAVLALLAAGINLDSLRDAVDPEGSRDVRRAQAAAELRRQATVLGLMTTWRQAVRDAHTDAVLSGTAAGAHYLSGGQIPPEPDTALLPDLFDPEPWIEQQFAGLGGDIARVLGPDSTQTALDDLDAALADVMDAGAGADYYLDQQLGNAWLDATTAIYRDLGVELVDWQTMSDERVCERCIGYAAGSPYPVAQVPDSHGRCRCWITPVDN